MAEASAQIIPLHGNACDDPAKRFAAFLLSQHGPIHTAKKVERKLATAGRGEMPSPAAVKKWVEGQALPLARTWDRVVNAYGSALTTWMYGGLILDADEREARENAFALATVERREAERLARKAFHVR